MKNSLKWAFVLSGVTYYYQGRGLSDWRKGLGFDETDVYNGRAREVCWREIQQNRSIYDHELARNDLYENYSNSSILLIFHAHSRSFSVCIGNKVILSLGYTPQHRFENIIFEYCNRFCSP